MATSRLTRGVQVAFATCAACIGAAGAAATSGDLRAGTAKIDITPTAQDLLTSTDVIRDHLYARAIAVDNGRTCAVLVSLDLSYDDDGGIQAGIKAAAAATGCPEQNILVSATHTHSSSAQGLEIGPPSPAQQTKMILAAATAAKARLEPARIGFGTREVDLNVNRDLGSLPPERRAEPGPEYPADKRMAVIEFLRPDGTPLGVYVNYGMHPTVFYQSGVISGDFPGAMSRYLETLFGDRAVAIYSQAAEGDLGAGYEEKAVTRVLQGQPLVERFAVPNVTPAALSASAKISGAGRRDTRAPVPADRLTTYRKAVELTGANVDLTGAFLGANAVRVMRSITPSETADIVGARETVTCPGRVRDLDKPLRPDGFPEYKDAPDIPIRISALRIGDIAFAAVDTEIYTHIGTRLKAASPMRNTVIVGLANGKAPTGYTYSDDAAHHLTFEVVGSHLKPGCAENKIVTTAAQLIGQVAKPQ